MNMKSAAFAALGHTCPGRLRRRRRMAADNGFYLGAGISQANTELRLRRVSAATMSTTTGSRSSPAGGRWTGWRSKQTTWIWAATVKTALSIDSSAISVSALVLAEIGIVDLYARAGMANWDTEFTADGVDSVSDDGWEPTYGVGVGVHFGSLGVRAEYERVLRRSRSTIEIDESDLDFSVSRSASRTHFCSIDTTGRIVTT